jgi:hypothetical protein
MQFILEKKAYRDINQATIGITEGQQHNQKAEVEKNSPPH